MGQRGTLASGNRPLWSPALEGPGRGFQEVWYLKLNDAGAGRALWLRFTILVRSDGSKRIAETWAIAFHRTDGSVLKTALKHTRRLDVFVPGAEEEMPSLRIGNCFFSDNATGGELQDKGRSIRWDLTMRPERDLGFDFVPQSLARARLVKNTALTVFEDLRFNGWSEVDGQRHEWRDAPGMQGHLAGPKNGHSWVWGHCNTFRDEQGNPVDCVWDGLMARARLGRAKGTPPLTSMLIFHEGRAYRLNRTRQALRTPSHADDTGWSFDARFQSITFHGQVRAARGQFAGVTYEDTDGSLLYCYNSKVSDMTIQVRRGDALERTLTAVGTVAFEVVTRERWADVPLLI